MSGTNTDSYFIFPFDWSNCKKLKLAKAGDALIDIKLLKLLRKFFYKLVNVHLNEPN